MTAHDVVAFARRRLGTRKVGHAGTLDPLAAGVLPVAAGTYTRLLTYLEGTKEYLAEVYFGRATTTGDAAGEIVEERAAAFGREELEAVLGRFRGEIEQVPPAFSALHVGGKRAYELARAGKTVEMPTRRVTIAELEVLRFESQGEGPGVGRPGGEHERRVALLRVSCSAGTYIRSLAIDIGAALGLPAHLSFLLRTRAGSFRIEDANLLTDAEWRPTPADVALAHLPGIQVTPAEAERLRRGQPISPEASGAPGEPPGGGGRGRLAALGVGQTCRLLLGQELVAMGEVRGKTRGIWPRTVLSAG